MQPPIAAIIANRYRIIEEIGRGGMGAVYLVKHLNTGDYLALKVIHEHALAHADAAHVIERFKREMRLPAKIRSEHVVKITDADTAAELKGAPFLVMELLNGCDLSKVLTRYGARSRDEVLWVLGQISKALDKAHSLGIVHRGLFPLRALSYAPRRAFRPVGWARKARSRLRTARHCACRLQQKQENPS